MLIGTRRALLGGTSYIDKVLGIEPANLVGLWPQGESSGSVSLDKSVHRHHGAYTDVDLGQPGVPGMRMTSVGCDGVDSFNNIHSAGLANDTLLSNGGFETAGAGDPDFWADWTESAGDGALANETTNKHEGTDAAKLTAGAGGNTQVYQVATVVAGKKYRLRFWTRGDGTYDGRYQVWDNDNSANIVVTTVTGVTGTAYASVVAEFTAPAGCTSARISLRCPVTDTGVCYFDACEVRSMDGFLGDELSVVTWGAMSADGVWIDTTVRQLLSIGVDANNLVQMGRTATNNQIALTYKAGGTAETLLDTSITDTSFHMWGLTASKSNNRVRAFVDDVQTGSDQAIAGTWLGDIDATLACIGASATTPADVHSGPSGPSAAWNKELSIEQIARLSKV